MRPMTPAGIVMSAVTAMDSEADAAIAFFGGTRRQRAEMNWGPRQRRRNRIRRTTQ